MLDQNLFRDNLESPTASSALIKQFQIASDVANNILDDDAEADFLPSAWTTPNSNQSKDRRDSQGNDLNTKSTASSCFDSFGGMSAKGASEVLGSPSEASMFSLQPPSPSNDQQPKLNA